MDFEDFALQFRKRAAARLTEFEATLEKAQKDLEKSAEREAARAREAAQKKAAVAEAGGSSHMQNRPLDYRTPAVPQGTPPQKHPYKPGHIRANGEAIASEKQQAPAPPKAPGQDKPGRVKTGQVKSVLRRG